MKMEARHIIILVLILGAIYFGYTKFVKGKGITMPKPMGG